MLLLKLDTPQISINPDEEWGEFAQRILQTIKSLYPARHGIEVRCTPLVVRAPAEVLQELSHHGFFSLDGVEPCACED